MWAGLAMMSWAPFIANVITPVTFVYLRRSGTWIYAQLRLPSVVRVVPQSGLVVKSQDCSAAIRLKCACKCQAESGAGLTLNSCDDIARWKYSILA